MFFVFTETVLLKFFHPLKVCQNTKFLGFILTGASLCIHVRSLNICHVGTVGATGLN